MEQTSKTFFFLILLVLSRSSFALTNEQLWLAKSIYHECREETICSIQDWQKIASVAYNRQRAYKVWKFGAKCNNIVCIVQSKEYTSSKLLGTAINETGIFKKIINFVVTGKFGNWKYLFFSTKGKGKKRKMFYRGNIDNLLGDNN
jgi:hypothetical protein